MRTSTRCNRDVPRGRTRWARGVTTLLTLVLLFVISQSVSAQCTTCTPVIAGHIAVDGSPCDWNSTNLSLIPIHTYIPDAHGNGVVDNSFTQGSKDFYLATDLRWDITQTKAKTDIANAAVAIVDGNLYFAGDRTSNNGDAQIGFWFYLNGTAPQDSSGVKNFAPEHAVGDLLVLANFTNGGNFADVKIYKWVGSGGNVPNTNGTLDSIITCSNVIVAQNNTSTYEHPSEWSFDSPCYEANEFYEGQIPLSCITGFGGNVCFKSFLLEARSSQSITASLDDFVAGGFAAAPNAVATGDLITCTHTTATLSGAGSSTIGGTTYLWTGPGSITNATSINATTTTGGVYTLTVTNFTGCTASATASVSVNATAPGATATGGSVNCTTTSTTLTGGPAGFNYSWTGPGGFASTAQSPTGVTAGGLYTLRVTNPANGCTSTATASVTVNTTPPGATASGGLVTCTTTSTTLTGGPAGFNYAWTGPGGFTSAVQSPTGVTAAGTYTLTVTNPANGCTSTATASVTVNNTPPGATASGGLVTCTTTSTTLTGGPAGFNYSWTGPGGFTSTAQSPTGVTAAGTYTLRVTNPANGCTSTATASVTVNADVPGATASGGLVTCTTTSTTLTGGPAGFNYSWTGPGGFTSTAQSPTGVTAAGTYTLRVTNPANGCTSTATASVTVNTTPPVATATGNTITCGNTTTTVTGTPATGVSYLWTGPGVVSGSTQATATVNAGGVYTLKVTSTANGCTASATASVSVAQCAVLCTYTQGYYGNVNGKSCSGVPDPAPNTFSTTALIDKSIANWGGTITIGCAGHSVTVSTGQAACVIDVLPGGKASAELPAGNYTICGLPGSLLTKQGRIANALLAQTLTLGLNMGINPPSLTNYPLQANKWLVTAETVECGSPDVKPCQFSCTPGITVGTYVWTVTYSPYHVSDCRISTALFNALGAKTVGGLYALANAALCNVDGIVGTENGISLTDIESAVDCINNAFDGCRATVGWFSGDTAPTANSFCTLPSSSTACPVTSTGAGRSTDMTVAGNVVTNGLQVSAYPNPYKDAVKFTIQSKVSGQAELVIYNSLGQKMRTIYNGYIQANRSQVVDYKTPSPSQGNLIYVLTIGGKQVTGKLLQVD
jgi:hypothetical protein